MLKAYLSAQIFDFSAFVISKTHIITQKPSSRKTAKHKGVRWLAIVPSHQNFVQQ